MEIMKSFGAHSDLYCMTEQFGICCLAQGHFESMVVDGRMLAVEGIEPMSKLEFVFLLKIFLDDRAALKAEII